MLTKAVFSNLYELPMNYMFLQRCGEVFGGVSLCVVGDLMQLPPVASREDSGKWLFEAKCWEPAKVEMFNLTAVYRQVNPEFKRYDSP